MNEMVGQKADGCCEQTDHREENRSSHPFWHFRMPEQLIRHYDEGREEEEAEIRNLGSYSQQDDKCYQTETPKTIVRDSFKGIDDPGVFGFVLVGRVSRCGVMLP